MTYKILFIGDVTGKPGRKVLREVLPVWQKEHQPDVTVVNVENLAHGKGVTLSTMRSLDDLNIDAYTSGNHIFDKDQLSRECFQQYPNLIRPDNFIGSFPGPGHFRFAKNGRNYLIINLNAQVFFEKQFPGEIGNPFFAADRLLATYAQKGDIILVDFHSEATSEKIALGWHLNGRATAVLGTHTHVPTADTRILSKGTAYQSDVGMTGPVNSVIGVKVDYSLSTFLEQGGFKMELEEEGPLMINGVLIEASEEGKALKAERLYREISN